MTERIEARPVARHYDRLTMRLAVVMLVIVAASYVINAADRQVFFVVLPGITEELSFSLASGGLLSTIFTLGIGVCGFPIGFVLDRYSRKQRCSQRLIPHVGQRLWRKIAGNLRPSEWQDDTCSTKGINTNEHRCR